MSLQKGVVMSRHTNMEWSRHYASMTGDVVLQYKHGVHMSLDEHEELLLLYKQWLPTSL